MSTKLKVTVAKLYNHRKIKAKCNGTDYQIPLPTQKYNFPDITLLVQFQPAYEKCLQVISQQTEELTITEFYTVAEIADRYFNISLSIDYDDLALKLLAEESNVVVEDLDSLKFPEMLKIFQKTYDNFTQKVHSKINRRLKRYLAVSKRSEDQKNKLNDLINLIKRESSQKDQKQPIKADKSNAESVPQKRNNEKNQKNQKKKIEKKNKVIPQDQEERNEKKNNFKYVTEEDHQKKHRDNRKHKNKDDELERIYGEKQSDELKPEGSQEGWQEVKRQRSKRQKKSSNRNNIKQGQTKDAAEDQWIDEDQYEEKKSKNSHTKYISKDSDHSEGMERNLSKESEGKQKKNHFYKEQRQKRQSNRNNSFSKERRNKKQADDRILLGINGDTEEGWRQRYRLSNKPLTPSQEEKSNQKYITNQNSQKQNSNRKPQKIVSIESIPAGIKQRIFSFPEDGKSYKFKPQRQYDLFVNKTFWINISKQRVIIQKDKKGYIRDKKVTIDGDGGISGDGFTISFDEMCNLEDGGQTFDNPVFKDFLIGDKQFFHLKSLEIYGIP